MSYVARLLGCLIVVLTLGSYSSRAETLADFYSRKEIKFVVGVSAGGGYDAYARLIARHFGKHLPGNPSVVVTNMPGAGSLVAARHIYSVAPKDGTYVGAIYASAIVEPLLAGGNTSDYDPSKFNFLGSANKETFICIARADSGVARAVDLLERELVIGATSAGGTTRDYPSLLNNVLGTKIRVVSGYPGTAEIFLAIERAEIQGACGLSWSNFSLRRQQWLSSKFVNVLLQEGYEGHSDLNKDGVPLAVDLAKSKEAREVLEFVYSQATFGRPYVTSPGVPSERVAALRAAFMDSLRDADLRADAAKSNLDIAPLSGEDFAEVIGKLFSADRRVVARARGALRR